LAGVSLFLNGRSPHGFGHGEIFLRLLHRGRKDDSVLVGRHLFVTRAGESDVGVSPLSQNLNDNEAFRRSLAEGAGATIGILMVDVVGMEHIEHSLVGNIGTVVVNQIFESMTTYFL